MVSNYHLCNSPRGYLMGNGDKFPNSKSAEVYCSHDLSDNYSGDLEMNRLWNEYRNLIGREVPTRLVLAITRRFVELVPNFEMWVYFNCTSALHLDNHGVDFIKDCIDFVMTGERKFSIMSWYDLIGQNKIPFQDVSTERTSVFANSLLLDTEELLSKWCSQKDGIRDLFVTCHILFCKD